MLGLSGLSVDTGILGLGTASNRVGMPNVDLEVDINGHLIVARSMEIFDLKILFVCFSIFGIFS